MIHISAQIAGILYIYISRKKRNAYIKQNLFFLTIFTNFYYLLIIHIQIFKQCANDTHRVVPIFIFLFFVCVSTTHFYLFFLLEKKHQLVQKKKEQLLYNEI